MTHNVLISPCSWLTRNGSNESAFQCSDDVYDAKIRGESVSVLENFSSAAMTFHKNEPVCLFLASLSSQV
jgi:hypothetical protein